MTKMVLVDWVDACFAADGPPKPLELQTMGFLTHKSKKYLTLSMQWGKHPDDGHDARDFVTIPTAYVKRITRLEKRPE